MAGLVPAIHVFLTEAKTWMPGTSPGMTSQVTKSDRVSLLARLTVDHARRNPNPPDKMMPERRRKVDHDQRQQHIGEEDVAVLPRLRRGLVGAR